VLLPVHKHIYKYYQQAIERVIRDYRNHFKNIRGEQLSQNAIATGYKSIINVPGTSNCSVTIYNNNQTTHAAGRRS
jgi:hypothetical protein